MAPKRAPIIRLTSLAATCVFVVASLIAGCMSMAPDYRQPTAPIAGEYPADAPRTESSLSGAIEWRSVFADTELQGIIELALENSRDLRAAVLRVQEARALRGIQRADRFPNVGASAGGERGRTPADLSILGRSTVSSAYQVAVGVTTWELDFWGRVRNLDIAAIENYLAADAARRAFTVSLVAQVAEAWLTQRELDRRLEIANRTVRSREESFRIFKRRYEVGSGTQLELMQVETLLTQAQSLTVQLERARATNRHALELLVGAPVDLPPRTDVFERDDEPVRAVNAGLPSDLLVQRPDIIAAEHQLRAAHANIGAARAAFLPRVALTGDFGTASAQLDGLFESGSRAWTFTPVISLPIFTGGRLRSNLDLAEVRRDLAVANYERTIQAAFRDVADALSVHHYLGEQLDIQRNALRALTERARLAQLRYESGAASYLEVLDAQRDLLNAEQAVVQLQSALQTSRVALFAALGGGALGRGQ